MSEYKRENRRKTKFENYKLNFFKKSVDKIKLLWYNNSCSIKRDKFDGGKTMSTYMAKASELERKWYIIDAEGKSLGRVAAAAAHVLRGKHLPTFTPHVDCGDHVIVINADKVVLTGNKLTDKYYYRHTGWIGGLKAVQCKTLMEKNPEKLVSMAIEGMLPNTTLGRKAATRLRVYKGAEHNHAAQKPQAWTQEIK